MNSTGLQFKQGSSQIRDFQNIVDPGPGPPGPKLLKFWAQLVLFTLFQPRIHSLKMMNWYWSSLNHWNPMHIIICLQVQFDNMWPYYITESYIKRYFRWVWSFEGYFIWLKADENLFNSVLLTVLLKICSKLNITRGDKLVISKFRYLLRE